MAHYGMNLYPSGAGRRPSSRQTERPHASPTLSPSGRGASGMAHMRYSSIDNQQINSSRHFGRSPDNASYHDGTIPLVLSPHPEADVNNMLSQASYAEEPRNDTILISTPHLVVPAHTVTPNVGHLSPWHPYRTEMGSDQNGFLNVTSYPRSRGAAGTARSSLSTVDTPYTASSDDRSDMSQERTEIIRPRGGREQGMRLPDHTVQNVRQVRQIGACFRCSATKEGCSPGTPCEKCSTIRGRKWSGCLRSFNELTALLTPEILARRLGSQALGQWISMNISFPPKQTEFDLPLNFGFGEPFFGFRGVEYIPTIDEARRTHAVGHGDIPLFSQSLNVYPVYSSSRAVQKLLWDWLKKTLVSRSGMEDWLNTCFPGSSVRWIRDLLQVVLEYSFDSWNDKGCEEADKPQLDDKLLEAWMACLLVTILSLPIAVPTHEVDTVVSYLQFVRYDHDHPYPNTSRALTKCVKSLLFDIYKKFVKRLSSTLDEFTKLAEISERHMTYMFCISVLIMVLTSQIQTSLMDNSRIHTALDVDQGIWEQTLEQLQRVEGVFKNTFLFLRKVWLRYIPVEGLEGSRLLALRRRCQEIGQRHRDAIDKHRKVRLERLKTRADWFHIPNMQRVFAFFFHQERGQSRRGG